MPPPDSNLVLTAREKQTLRHWIKQGAEYEAHWAFTQPPASIPLPETADPDWPQQPLDHFVLARLEQENTKPSPEAAPLRWLRRATLDLTGLPPNLEEISNFRKSNLINHQSSIDSTTTRLLASPAFGEHMAVAWLDAARYADSFGYQSDQLNTQWPYRDWVIRAFNDNLPFDQFLTWQLAGDLLPDATRDQRLATAFNRIHRLTNEGGSIPAEFIAENAADRVHTFGTTFLALTFECARCHDHKYDPLTTREYYSMAAFFNSIDENGLYDHARKVPSPTLMLPTPEQEQAIAKAREDIESARLALAETIRDESRFQAWLADPTRNPEIADLEGIFDFETWDNPGDKIPNRALDPKGNGKRNGLPLVDGPVGKAIRFDGDTGASFPDLLKVNRWTPFTVSFWLRDTARSSEPILVAHRSFGTDVGYNGFDIRLVDGFPESRLFRIWPGNAIGVRATSRLPQNEWHQLTVRYDGSSSAAGLTIHLDGKPLESTVLRDRIHKSAAVKTHGGGHFTLGQRFRDRGFAGGEIDELHIYRRALTPLEITHLHDGTSLAAAVAAPQPDHAVLRDYYFSSIDPPAREAAKRLLDARKALVTAEDKVHEVSVMEELPEPRETHLLARGAYDARTGPDTLVTRNTPAFLPPLTDPASRLDLAHWLINPNHPLTARVFVNRLWANFFSRGLVDTPDNFGLQGALPSHPQLLDFLARDFIDSGWDVKELCRNIVLSSTYRQDSALTPNLARLDPENILLARGPAHRLSAEQIRDSALAASGLLDPNPGGPPVSPYQPGGDLWREANGMSPAYRQSTGKALHRRSLYSVWKRTAPLPNMLAFDSPTREVCNVRRARTNTPLQALVLLNDIQFIETARALAARTLSEKSTDDAARLASAFSRLTGRPPLPTELDILTDALEEQHTRFRAHPEEAKALLAHGETKPDPALDPAELAAWTVVCQTILNTDSFAWKR